MKLRSDFVQPDFEIEKSEGIYIIKVNLLRITAKDAKVFQQTFDSVMASGHNKVIINFSGCVFVDSTIVGVLIKVLRNIQKIKGDIRAVTPRGSLNNLFVQTHLDKLIKCYDTTKEALNSYSLTL
jgi:anti-anti-sigma factor